MEVDTISASAAQNSYDLTSLDLNPAPHMFHCWYEYKTFSLKTINKNFLDVKNSGELS